MTHLKKKVIAGILILAIVAAFMFQQNKTTNFEDIVSTNAEKIAEIEVTKDVFGGNKERVSFMKKEAIEAFLNEFSGLKLKKNKDNLTFTEQYNVLIMSDKVHLDYLIMVYDNKHISIHHNSQNSTSVLYEIVNDGEVNLDKFFQQVSVKVYAV